MNDITGFQSLHVKIVRGGSSKGIFVQAENLPAAGPARDQLLLRLFGAPDIRQIDGLGGGDKLTSKLAIMGPPTREDCDISYLFAQVGTEFPDLDWHSNCGNISAGAALFAAIARAGRNDQGSQAIAIEQANTGRRLLAKVPMYGDAPSVKGNFAIGGVPGTGPRIDLDFADFDGSCLNMGLFPTGERQQELVMPDGQSIPVTVIDMANLNVLVDAADLGIDLTSPLHQLQNDTALLDKLDHMRATVMIQLGQATPETAADVNRRSVNPLVNILAKPQSYTTLNGARIATQDHDVLARSYARRAFSKAYPGTGAIGTGVAMRIAGTTAAIYGANVPETRDVRIGHPSGCLDVRAQVQDVKSQLSVETAKIGRTARVLMEGTAYLT